MRRGTLAILACIALVAACATSPPPEFGASADTSPTPPEESGASAKLPPPSSPPSAVPADAGKDSGKPADAGARPDAATPPPADAGTTSTNECDPNDGFYAFEAFYELGKSSSREFDPSGACKKATECRFTPYMVCVDR